MPSQPKPAIKIYLCPSCALSTSYACPTCGATRHTNPVSGQVTWMRSGRLLRGFHNERSAWILVAREFDIPRDVWPEYATEVSGS